MPETAGQRQPHMISSIWLRFVLRPFGRLLRTDRWEPHFVVREQCLECGHEHTSVIAASTPLYDPESDALYGLECANCGEMAATTLGVMDAILRVELDPCRRII
jgi:hypothetical protein